MQVVVPDVLLPSRLIVLAGRNAVEAVRLMEAIAMARAARWMGAPSSGGRP